jgi:two-component system, LuxR family, sensor kinase FixL
MDWVTVLWAMLIWGCVAVALPNQMIETWRGRAGPSNFAFALRTIVTGVVVSVGYYLGAKLGFALTFQPHPVSVLWPPNSILVAGLLLTPLRIWWFLLLAAFPAHWAAQVQSHVPPLMILCWFVSNSCEALIGAGLTRYLAGGPIRFTSLRNAGIFGLCAVFAGPFLSSFLDAAFVVWNHWGQDSYWDLIRVRFFSNVLAALIVVPLIVTWATDGILALRTARLSRYFEAGALFLGLFSIGFVVFYKFGAGVDSALLFLPLPLLLWAAVRFGALGASTAISIVSLLAIWSASHGHGPFSGGTPEQNARSIQIFLIVLSIPILLLATVLEERAIGETDLRESESRFRIVADAAPVLIWMSGVDKLYTFFNKAWLDFTGRTMEQELGNGWSKGVHVEDLEKFLETYGQAFDAREPFVLQYRLRRHDGEYRSLTDNGVPRYNEHGRFLGYIGGCVDVTDLLQKEKALREIEERVTLVAQAAHLGVWEMNTSTNEIWMSDAARALFQFDADAQITHAVLQDRLYHEDRAFRDSAVKQAIERHSGYEIEYRVMLPDGALRWVGGRARCVTDAGGKLTRLLGVSIDVTERKIAEEQARRHREEISRLSRIALLGEMTASIAHEVNQPLTAIINNASAGQCFIDQGDIKLDALRGILVDIAADGHRAHHVISNIRNTIKKGAILRELVDINFVVTKVAHMFQPDMAAHSCELETSLAKDLPTIEADPIQIHQVLINLVSNALDAMHDTPPPRRKVQIATKRNGNGSIEVAVRDCGAGISDEVRERLFDQFFTTKEKGLGMGLAIVRSIIEAHGGTIEVENRKGGGARFYFILPISQEIAK